MTSLFVAVLNMSITASYIAAAVIVIRILLKNMPKVYSYVLWLAVLIRLVCPFSFNSSFSLLGLLEPNLQADGGTLKFISYNAGSIQDAGTGAGVNSIGNLINSSLPAATPAASANPVQIYLEIASLIWIAGIVVLLIYSIVSYIKVRNNVKTATLVKDNFFETDRITTAFIFGLVKPKIYVPVGMSDQDLSYILAHEKVHIDRLDYLIKPFAFLALIVHWFNPLMWVSFALMSKDMEMSCDEGVIKKMGSEAKGSYSNSLLSLSMKRNRLLPGSPLAFGESNIKARIINVLNYKKPALWMLILTVIVLFALFMVFIANPKDGQIFKSNTYSGYALGVLADNKTAYVGNNSKVAALIDAMPLPQGIKRSTIELQTAAPPYGITVDCTIKDIGGLGDQGAINNIFYRNSIMLFSLIDNVDIINYNITDETSHNAVFSFTCSRATAEKLLGQDVRQYTGSVEALKNLIDRLNAMSFAPNAGSNTSDSTSFAGNEPAGNSIGGKPQTGQDRISISKRFFPVTGEYLLPRVNLETGDYQVSFDDGATWLFRRVDPETRQAEYSADGANWYTMPSS
ncbi:MAG: M56 family metallopeptidase [Syntrophomonas sp.]